MSVHPIEAERPQVSPQSVATPLTTPERLSKRTRTSGAWAALSFGLAVLTIVFVFVLQNLKSVEVTFLSFHGRLPLAILLMLVAMLGALTVFAFGAARVVQLRMKARSSKRGR